MAKSTFKATFPDAVHDFFKRNGVDASFATEGPSLTRQEFKEECDINSLMARYEGHVIGGPGNLAPLEGMYADFTQAPRTLLEYMSFMQDAENAFMSLPAVVRKEFDNSAQMFVEFASDPENLPQMRDWGLAPPAKPPAEPSQAPPASAASSAPPAAPSASQAPGAAPTHGST